MIPRSKRLTAWLQQSGPVSFSLFAIAAAFSTYFCMYAFRKPYTAGEFLDVTIGPFPFKPVLVAVQVFGYMCAKFLGIKFVSEIGAKHRAAAIIGLIMLSELALLLFGLTPAPWNTAWLFFNGLSLGMVFGLVVVFLEGRKLSEALVAGLCASFIVSSGYVKSVGRYMIAWGVSEYWMPFYSGLVFVVPLLVAVWFLNHLPQPSDEDVRLRAARDTMNRAARWSFYRRHAFGLSMLLLIFIALTTVRGIRDDFAVEIWSSLGFGGKPAIFAQSETWVMFGVVAVNGAAIWIKNNRLAFISSLVVTACGFGLALIAVYARQAGQLGFLDAPGTEPAQSGAFAYMVLLGLGLYLPYIAFHTTVFERLIAAFRDTATLGFLITLADALGYLAYVVIVFWDNFGKAELDYLGLLNRSTVLISWTSIVICVVLIVHYWRTIPRTPEAADQ